MAASTHSSANPTPSNPDTDPFSSSSPFVPLEAGSRASSAAKRKLDTDYLPIPEKRQRHSTTSPNPPHDGPSLPVELWHHVFSYLSPESLARVRRVSPNLNSFLTADHTEQDEELYAGVARPLQPARIWARSRASHYPDLPKPLAGVSEWEMWSLIKGKGCTICDEPYPYSTGGFPFEAGPHNDSVRIIWPFAVRCCRKCLREGYQTESTLLFSDFTSAVIPTLPFAFITKKDHIVSSAVLKRGSNIPPTLEIRKIFYTTNVEKNQRLIESASKLSPSRAEERFEELKAQRDTRMREIDTWELWEENGGLKHINVPVNTPDVSPPGSSHPSVNTSPTWSRPMSSTNTATQRPFSRPSHHAPAKDRDPNEVQEAKASRRYDIEQRCRDLDPPLSPSLLEHMESFQAAIQISSPLTQRDWEVLKPRLLSQVPLAEQRENERTANEDLSHGRQEERRQQDVSLREVKEASDRQWEESQSPIRDQLGEYADEMIRNEWADGETITVENAPQFAADILVHVRKRFYSDLARENRSGSESTPPRNLVLDNMKWVYDTRIKPLTEKYRKDLFLCNGCSSRYMAFDGVIQHYGAKHTNRFSVGNIIVHWQSALWPETPPFAPNPDMKRGSNGHGHFRQGSNNYPGQSQRPFPVPMGQYGMSGVPSNLSPAPYGNPHFPNAQETGQYGPWAPPSYSYPPQQLMNNDPRSYSPVHGPMRGPPTPGQPMYYPPTSPAPHTPFQSGWGPPPYDTSFSPATHGGMMPPPGFGQGHGPYPMQGNPYPVPGGFPGGSLYQEQKDHVAYIALDVWRTISRKKAIPSNVRTYVIIHHVVSKFSSRFSNEPSLELFQDCLINHPSMAPIKSANDLLCKACVLSNESSPAPHSSESFGSKSNERKPFREKKLYPFHSLLNHFNTVHVQPSLSSDNNGSKSPTEKLDWKEDMIDLPNDDFIEGLKNTPDMDNETFQLIAGSFPHIFQLHISTMSESRGRTNASSDRSSPISVRKRERHDEDEIALEERPTSKRPNVVRSPSSQSPPAPRDDEYDPRRPAYLESDQSMLPKRPHGLLSEEPEPPRQVSRGSNRPNFARDVAVEPANEHTRIYRQGLRASANEADAERFLADFTPEDSAEYRRRGPLPRRRGDGAPIPHRGGRRLVRASAPVRDECIVVEGPARESRDGRTYEGPSVARYEIPFEESSRTRPIYIRPGEADVDETRIERQQHGRFRYYEEPPEIEPVQYIYVRRRDGVMYQPRDEDYDGEHMVTYVSHASQDPADTNQRGEEHLYVDDEDLPDAPPPSQSANRSRR